MENNWFDNVPTTSFTPRDYQVELLACALERNIITSLGSNSSKEFIVLKLLQELSYQTRNNDCISIFITNNGNGETIYNLILHLTDLEVLNNNINNEEINLELLKNYQIIILNPIKCYDIIAKNLLQEINVNLIVIEDCHKNEHYQLIKKIINYFDIHHKPKILGLAGPIYSARCSPSQLSGEIKLLENDLKCSTETASDVVTVLRYCSRPTEFLVQCLPLKCDDLVCYLQNLILTKKAFLKDHRYDPSEIYSGDLLEEIKNTPDPKVEPLKLLDNYLEILNDMGPWCADKAALNLIIQIEKLKVKIPYERHFLLLCLVSTTLVEIRAFCDEIFQKIENITECILKYSSPKIVRLLELLSFFTPKDNPQEKSTDLDINNDIDKFNYKNVDRNIEKNIDDLSEKEISQNVHVQNIFEYKTNKNENEIPLNQNITNIEKSDQLKNGIKLTSTKSRFKRKFNSNHIKNKINFYNLNNSDNLCGILYCNNTNSVRVLFSLLQEISRNDVKYNFLKTQYTINGIADPITEPNIAENEHRKQEEVLKRFRMHECNLLIATTVLEDGIDLPKCNLVIRWDTPISYRSYVQCKGKARARQAFHIIMVSNKLNIIDKLNDSFDQRSHKFVCEFKKNSLNTISNTITNEVYTLTPLDDLLHNLKSKSMNGNLDEFKCNITKIKIDQEFNKQSFDELNKSTSDIIKRLAHYMEIEKILLHKCANKEPSDNEHITADEIGNILKSYQPLSYIPDSAFVNLNTSISLINRYCAKLPSDTFTKLTPLWRNAKTKRNDINMYQCTLRLPINSPLKHDIIGLPMPTSILARRITALLGCIQLHKIGELDNYLQPIGKEGFKANEPDWEDFQLEDTDSEIFSQNYEPRPGTTKRRQYYYKRIASAFIDCRPTVEKKTYFYWIKLTLVCPIPEEQNTRGRKIYPPEETKQSFGILTSKKIPKVSAFPIFTRSGEVRVTLELISENINLTKSNIQQINIFVNYIFTNVLRLQKFLMLFNPDATENCFFIVPTIKINDIIEIDWKFLNLIFNNYEKTPNIIPEELRKNQEFIADKFKDAVVMPWYRNQDQPQYFYVAEICYHLSPLSEFPGENYSTFQEYYYRKYDINIQNTKQPLLDVDHTSARLNFLTPRYVNRKGVALPTSSEETKRAKRESLEQKQILVPELCTIHPFPASLWRSAVCLPCIIYRINALLLADEIRKKVSYDIGLGKIDIEDDNFNWPILDFGWSLAEVLKKSRDLKKDNDNDIKNEKTENLNNEVPDEDMRQSIKLEENFHNMIVEDIKTANDVLEEVDEKLKTECVLEIGTWSNDMANDISSTDECDGDDEWGLLPPNINMCSRNNTKIRYGSPTSWNVGSTKRTETDINYYDSDLSYQSDDSSLDFSIDNEENDPGVFRIKFQSNYLAEAFETEKELQRRQKKLEFIKNTISNEKNQNIEEGYINFNSSINNENVIKDYIESEQKFLNSIENFENDIITSNMLIKYDKKIKIIQNESKLINNDDSNLDKLTKLVPYFDKNYLINFFKLKHLNFDSYDIKVTIDDLQELNNIYLKTYPNEKYEIEGCGHIFDHYNDCKNLKYNNGKYEITIDYRKNPNLNNSNDNINQINHNNETYSNPLNNDFSFDYQPNLIGHPGPSPSVILQALTMSNANDGINLERLETIGDSFLKYAITTYLYCKYENVHEGKLSHLRSKQVSNLNLYRLGRKKVLGENMIATKFEPHDNWLPPCYYVPKELEKALIEAKIPAAYWNLTDLPNIKNLNSEEICELVKKKAESLAMTIKNGNEIELEEELIDATPDFPCFIPYNLVTQHSIPDKSIADCVEALIGAYLIECGPRGALLFMAWLGIRVIPIKETNEVNKNERIPGSFKHNEADNNLVIYGEWSPPKSPLLTFAPNPYESLELLLNGYSKFEESIGYKFKDRAYLLQAMTHASYTPNRLTDCYQRLEFLGDAVLDYLITRHLYEDPRQHSPGALTDLRSALVNNTIFASLAVRHNFHKFFRHLSPALNDVIERFVRIQHENGYSISEEEYYLLSEEECDDAEDVEVPKALGDVFESIAGAIFLDSNMSLDAVWKVYSNMMKPEIEQFSNFVPKSPIRELLELEPETAKFSKPEKLADGRRVRVTVEVFGKGSFRGIGRNYRIAKCTAAKCALRQLKKQGLLTKRHS